MVDHYEESRRRLYEMLMVDHETRHIRTLPFPCACAELANNLIDLFELAVRGIWEE